MSTSQRADGRWLVKYKVDAKWVQKTFRDEATARAFDLEQAEETEDSRLSLMELAASFFQSHPDYHRETRKKILHFINGYTNASGMWIDGKGQFLRDKYAEELTRTDLELMREAMRKRGSGNATINKMQAYIRAILAWGVDQQLIRLNPWRDVSPRVKPYKLLVNSPGKDSPNISLHFIDSGIPAATFTHCFAH